MPVGNLTRFYDTECAKVRCLRGAYVEKLRRESLTDMDVFVIARAERVDTCRESARYDFERFNDGEPLISYVEAEYFVYFPQARA